eukprot:9033245-Alexandrium_andersonii.AAC.1
MSFERDLEQVWLGDVLGRTPADGGGAGQGHAPADGGVAGQDRAIACRPIAQNAPSGSLRRWR